MIYCAYLFLGHMSNNAYSLYAGFCAAVHAGGVLYVRFRTLPPWARFTNTD